MTLKNYPSAIDDLNDLLDSERDALLSGKINTVNNLAQRKQRLIQELDGVKGESRDKLFPLREKIGRNQKLLESALDGIRAVADRIAEIRSIRSALHTYDRSGEIREISLGHERQVETRA